MKRKSDKISGHAFQRLTEDHCAILRRAFESYLIWEYFGDLIRDVHRGDAQYSRVFFFQPLTLAFVSAAFDSFIVNLYKFYDRGSLELETLIDVGVKHGRLQPWLASSLKKQIEEAASFAAMKSIGSLRKRNVAHYDRTAEERSALTTIDPTKKEILDYFKKLAAILQICASRARFNHSPPAYDQFEKRIRDTAKMIIHYVSEEKS
jgi:hypothetical protein